MNEKYKNLHILKTKKSFLLLYGIVFNFFLRFTTIKNHLTLCGSNDSKQMTEEFFLNEEKNHQGVSIVIFIQL